MARFLDGSMIHGTTIDFSPTRRVFRLSDGAQVHEVELSRLKALFFVKDFAGNPQYDEKKAFLARQNHGKKVVVEFKDGETLFGYTLTYSSQGFGFFVFPGDPDSNNEKIFVLHAATASVKLTAAAGLVPPTAHTA